MGSLEDPIQIAYAIGENIMSFFEVNKLLLDYVLLFFKMILIKFFCFCGQGKEGVGGIHLTNPYNFCQI